MNKKLKEELTEEKLRFTQIWVNRMLSSSNKEWSSEQKRFIDALYDNYNKNRIINIKSTK